MNQLRDADLSGARDCDVIHDPHDYEVVGFSYNTSDEVPYCSLSLTLERGASRVVLLFEGVHELEVDAGFPHSYFGLEILDVTHLGWEHSRVRVQGFEDAPGIRFWAREVKRVVA